MATQILVYHGKHGDEYWLADTPEREAAAYLALFKLLDEWHCYEDYDEPVIAEARAGNWKTARSILRGRCDYEYEGWHLEVATDPCEPQS